MQFKESHYLSLSHSTGPLGTAPFEKISKNVGFSLWGCNRATTTHTHIFAIFSLLWGVTFGHYRKLEYWIQKFWAVKSGIQICTDVVYQPFIICICNVDHGSNLIWYALYLRTKKKILDLDVQIRKISDVHSKRPTK